MMFWILIAVLTAAAALAVLVPLNRPSGSAGEDGDTGGVSDERTADTAVYRQQLAEVDRDLERGLIDAEAAEAARTEIARRLLAADARANAPQLGHRRSSARAVALAAMVAIPVGGLLLYFNLGSPDLPDQPLQARLTASPDTQSVAELIARVERHLVDNPQDGQGWSVLAPVYMRMGNPQAAARAYANAIRILGSNVQRETDHGEALTVANGGIVGADAHAAFERALALDATAVKPRFFMALALGQEGKTQAALKAWSALVEGADPSEPWVAVARDEMAKLGAPASANGRSPASPAGSEAPGAAAETPQASAPEPPGPDAGDVAAAQEMSAAERSAMIEGMVSGLEDRLNTDGGTVEEWLRLIRSQAILGKRDKALAALSKAREAYAGDAAALGQINELARQAGLEGS